MQPLRQSRISVPSVLGYVFVSIAILFLIAYIIFQSRFLIEGPVIILTNEPETLQNARDVTLSGSTRNITNITLNGRPIVTDENGNFQERVILENGYTIVSIRAEDRYGRVSIVKRPFVYQPQTPLLN